MAIRTSTRTVIFTRPFRLGAIGDEQPAGSYDIETDEERLDTVAHPAYRRIATWMRVPLPSGFAGSQTIIIDPAELESALARDAVPEAC